MELQPFQGQWGAGGWELLGRSGNNLGDPEASLAGCLKEEMKARTEEKLHVVLVGATEEA